MASPNPQSRHARRAIIWLVAAAACFGLDTTLSAYALQQLQPPDLFVAETFVGCRRGLGGSALDRRLPTPGSAATPPRVGDHGAGRGLPVLRSRPSSHERHECRSSPSTETLLAVALAVIVLGERLRPLAVGALVAGVGGTVAVSTSGGGGHATLVGNLLVLAGSMTAGSYYLIARRLPTDDDALTGTGFQLLAAAGIALAYAAVAWPIHGSGLRRRLRGPSPGRFDHRNRRDRRAVLPAQPGAGRPCRPRRLR